MVGSKSTRPNLKDLTPGLLTNSLAPLSSIGLYELDGAPDVMPMNDRAQIPGLNQDEGSPKKLGCCSGT